MRIKFERPYFISFVVGLLACGAVSHFTGRREAWDSPLYFTFAVPVMMLVIFILSYRYSERPWRWTVAMAVGQSLAMALSGNSLSLWPLSIVAMTVCSVPQFFAGQLGGWLKRRRTQ